MIKICLYNEKPSVGKSSLSIQLANIIKRKFERTVSIIDYSEEKELFKKRENEFKRFYRQSSEEEFKNLANIYSSKTTKVEELNDEFIFFDIDTINDETIDLLISCNYVFIVSDNYYDNSADKNFILDNELVKTFKRIRMDEVPLKDILLVVNKYRGKEIDKQLDDTVSPFIKDSQKMKNIITIATTENRNVMELTDNIYRLITNEAEIIAN